MKGVDMTIHKCFQGTSLYKFDVHGPGKTENQHKGINSGRFPIKSLNLEITPVNLGLEPRLRLETDIGQLSLLFFDTGDIMLYRVIAAWVSDLLDPIENPGCLVIILIKVVVDDLFIWFPNAYALTFVVMRKISGLNMFLHSFSVNA